MTQATHTTKKLRHKDLKQPDEFISLSGQVVEWARKNALAVQVGVGAAVLLLLTIAGARWYMQSRDQAAARDFYGASELFKREQWDAAQQDFAELAKSYGSTPYGTLAKLYAGRAALNAQKPADAVPPLTEFVAAAPMLTSSRRTTIERPSSIALEPEAEAARKVFSSTTLPSSLTSKSSLLRSVTGRWSRSVTTTAISTRSTDVGSCACRALVDGRATVMAAARPSVASGAERAKVRRPAWSGRGPD
jgi:hypothetical protein